MASWLVLDWDHDQFQVLCAQGGRGRLKVTRALTWDHPEPFTPSTADSIGKALAAFLKAKSIAPAPVIVGVGRDRVFLKELRFPPIAAHEEPNLVRFQTGKEMAEPVDNYAVDYTHLANGASERRVMTVAARRDIVAMIQTMCQAAGLKLHAVTPRLFGVPHVLARAIAPETLAPRHLSVVLAFGERWSGLVFLRGDQIVQAQALAKGPQLAGEVKRSLAVFLAQNATSVDVDPPACLYVFGDDEAAVQSLKKSVQLPFRMLDPLKDEPQVSEEAQDASLFAGAIGLAALWSDAAEKPVNLATPKRPSAPTSLSRQRALIYGVAAAVVVIFASAGMAYSLSVKRGQINDLLVAKANLERDMTDSAQARAEVDSYIDWRQSKVPWLDEMYDLTARFPFKKGFRVNQFAGTSFDSKKGAKDGYIGRVALVGLTLKGDERNTVYALQSALSADPHLRSGIDGIRGQTNYSMKIDIAKQDYAKYITQLVVPPKQKAEEPKLNTDKNNAEEIVPPDDKKLDPDADEDGGNR